MGPIFMLAPLTRPDGKPELLPSIFAFIRPFCVSTSPKREPRTMKPLQSLLTNSCVWGISALFLGLILPPQVGGEESTQEALNVYAEAAGFQNGGQYDLAADEWENFLKRFNKDPLFKKAQHYAGVCRLQLQEYEKAAVHFEQVVKDPKFAQLEDAFLNLAWCQYSSGQEGKPELYPKAATTFSTLVERFPKGKHIDQALFYLGESEYAQDKKKEAVAAYKQLVDDHKKSTRRADALYAMGVTLEELSDYPQAGLAFDVFLEEYTTSPLVTEVRMRKAESILQAGDLKSAAKMFAEVSVVEGFAAADHAIFRQAFCASQQKEFGVAGTLYAKLATDFPKSGYVAEATIMAGRNFYRGEKPADAQKWLLATIQADGDDIVEAAHWLCRIYIEQGKYAESSQLAAGILPNAAANAFYVDLKLDEADAIYEVAESRPASLDKYLQIAADHADHRLAPQSLYNASFAALDLKRFADGLEHADDLVAKYKDDVRVPDAMSVAAECCLHLAKYADAEKRFSELVAMHADHEEISNWKVRLGLVLFLQKKYPEAIASLAPLLGVLSGVDQIAEVNFYIGSSHFHEDQQVECERAFTASLAANSKWRSSDEVWLLLSRSQRSRDEFDLARTSVKHVLTDFPDSKLIAEANYRLGEYNYAADDFAAAAQAYGEVITKFANSPFTPFAMYGKGWSQLKQLRYPEGVYEFSALISKHPEHELSPDSHFGRAMCLRQLSKYDDAIVDIDNYLKTEPKVADKSNALYERGQCEVGTKNYAAAVATFTSLLEADAKYANASGVLYEIGWALKNNKKEEEATAAFARIVAEHGDSSFAPEANFHVGESQYGRKEYDAAAKSYSAAQKRATVAELSEQATHKLGWTFYRLEQYEDALAQFDEQLKTHVGGKLYADAAFMRGESLFESKEFADALAAFTAARKTLPKSEAMQVLLLLHGGQSAAQIEQWQRAGDFLEPIPDKYPKTPILAEILLERGRTRQHLNRFEPALEDFERAATISRTEIGAQSRFMIGEVKFQQKQYTAAISTFRKVMYGYGGEKAIDEIKPWQAVSGFEAGRCAETQIRSANGRARTTLIANAKKFYGFVVEKHPTSEYATKAKQRLVDLAKLGN
jgi:TolA-binding protein